MKNNKYTQPDRDRVALETADWREVRAAYLRGLDEGRTALAAKHYKCKLCPKYRKYMQVGHRLHLSCRLCPVVRVTGHTCFHWRGRYGFDEHWMDGIDTALRFTMTVLAALDAIGRIMEAADDE